MILSKQGSVSVNCDYEQGVKRVATRSLSLLIVNCPSIRRLLRRTNVLLTMTLMTAFISCSSNEVKPTTAALTIADNLPTQTSHHTKMSFSSEGKVRAVLNAIGVRVFEQKRYTMLDSSVHLDFFDKETKHSSVLTSRRALIDDNSKDMTAYDSVKILSDSGTLVETDSLVWDNGTHKLHSDAFVRITEKTGRITRGHGFESDQDLVNYKILLPIIDAPTGAFQNFSNPGTLQSPNQPLSMPPAVSLSPPEVKKDTSKKK
jgi:LPS export ABC transporter protein LptC